MKRCLATCAYSRLRTGDKRLQACLEEADLLVIPVVVMGELYAGFAKGSRKAENEARLEEFLEIPSIRIQDTNWDIARRYGLLVAQLHQAGTPIPTNDIWIAATTLELGARLVTYDDHFRLVPGLIVEAP